MFVKLRQVTKEDCDLLFQWANDETVRENCFNSNTIPYEEHLDWFNNKLNSDKSYIYICLSEEKAIGQVRVDVENQIGTISYCVAREYRGLGYGTLILGEIIKKIKCENIFINKLIGKVKDSNIPSCKAFEKAGYFCNNKNDYIEYYKKLAD